MSTATLTQPLEEFPEADYWGDEDLDHSGANDHNLLDRVSEAIGASETDQRMVFELLADELERAMLGAGTTRRITRQPAYYEILNLGDRAIPLLLDRVRRPGARPVWLRILGDLTAYQPGAGQKTVPEAAAEWIRWGKLHGYT